MSHTPHELVDDFPEHSNRISELRQTDAHFARLVDEYHDLNRAVHRAETDVAPVSHAQAAHVAQGRAVRYLDGCLTVRRSDRSNLS